MTEAGATWVEQVEKKFGGNFRASFEEMDYLIRAFVSLVNERAEKINKMEYSEWESRPHGLYTAFTETVRELLGE